MNGQDFESPMESDRQLRRRDSTEISNPVRLDCGAVLKLAIPLMANTAVQIVLSLTDMWFIGRISTNALAAVGAVQWLVLAVVLVLGGIGPAAEILVARSYGARVFREAAEATWGGLWASVFLAPAFVVAGLFNHTILAPFRLDPEIETLAAQFWCPRVAGAVFGVALSATFGFFNGTGRPGVTAMVSIATAVANGCFNEVFIFRMGLGIAGSAWASTAAQACGLLVSLRIFLSAHYRGKFDSHRAWRPRVRSVLRQLRVGIPMGVLPAADLLGFSIFQIMQVRLGAAAGAATQMATALTAIAYLPAVGIAGAGAILVGQELGAGNAPRAMRVGTHVIVLTTLCSGSLGLLIAVAGPWLLPVFAGSRDSQAAAAVALGGKLLWWGTAYQFFDGLNLGSTACLRGAGDTTVPAILVLVLSWLVFLPIAHSFTFTRGQGWIEFLPQFGWGTVGGWVALILYVTLIGTALFFRWRSGAWVRNAVDL